MAEIKIREAAASFARFIEAKVGGAEEFAALSPAEVVELTFEWHGEWQASPGRKAERENARADREAKAAEDRAERDAKRAKRLEEEAARIERRLAELRSRG